MWPWKKKRQNTAIRDEKTGKIIGNVPVNSPAPAPAGMVYGPRNSQVENEIANFSAVGKVMEQMKGLGLLGGGEEESDAGILGELDGWQPVIMAVVPFIGPYLPGLIEKYTGVTPTPPQGSPPEGHNGGIPPQSAQEASPQAAAANMDFNQLITMAASSPPLAIKAFIPELNRRLEAQGIKPEIFKKALANINKAI